MQKREFMVYFQDVFWKSFYEDDIQPGIHVASGLEWLGLDLLIFVFFISHILIHKLLRNIFAEV